MAGYALARMEFPVKRVIFGFIIATLFVPGVHLPDAQLHDRSDRLGWLDTLWSVIVPGAAGAFGVFFMRQFFLGLPVELEESAPDRRRRAVADRSASIVLPQRAAGAGHAGRADLPGQLERLHLADLRAVLARAADPAVRPGPLQGAYAIDYPVIMAGAALAASRC